MFESGETLFDVENNFPGPDQDQGLGPEFPKIVPKIPTFVKIIFLVEIVQDSFFLCFVPLIPILKYKN